MLRKMILAAAFVLTFAPQAQADTFVWRDDVYGFTMSFPDSWSLQATDSPSTRLRIAGPLIEDWPTCRMQVLEDKRLNIYPKKYMDEAVEITLDQDYWQKEVGQYNDAAITDYYAPASMGGRGDATAVQVSYVQDDGADGKIPMHGLMIAGIYGGNRYVASCSSRAETVETWLPIFASILGSVELDSRYHPFATGYYRNFLMDPKLVLPRVKPGSIARKNGFWPSHRREFVYNR